MRPKRKNPLGMDTIAYFLERGMKKNPSNPRDYYDMTPAQQRKVDARMDRLEEARRKREDRRIAKAEKREADWERRQQRETSAHSRRRNTPKSRGNFKVCKASSSRGNKGIVQKFYIRLNSGKRRNPEDTAAERYEYFHGRQAEIDTTVETKFKEHTVLSGIGKLLKLEIVPLDGRGIVKVEGFKGALLAQDEKGKQLYIVGGDQSVDISKFGIEQTHELEILGQLRAVLYFTTKDHLRPEDGGTAAYDHKFAKGSMPFVGYDVRNKLLSIQGGGYELPAEGIDG